MNFLLLFFTIFSAALACDIGVIDSNIIFNNYKKKDTLEKKLENFKLLQEQQLLKEKNTLLKIEEKILKKKQPTSKEKNNLAKLEKKLEEKTAESQKQINIQQQEYLSELQRDISIAALIIGKEEDLDILLDRSALIYGGVDITNKVLESLNNPKTIPLDSTKYFEDNFIN